MKTQLLRTIGTIFLFLFAATRFTQAQTYMSDTYGYACYNYFDNTTLSKTVSGTTTTSSTANVYAPTFLPDPDLSTNNTSLVVSSAAANNLSNNISSGRCLQSKYQATPKAIFVNNINTSDQSSYAPLNNNDWEWNIIYKSNLSNSSLITNANNHNTLSASTYAWRYWLQTPSTQTTGITTATQGFFLTQTNDGKLVVCVNDGNTSDGVVSLTHSDLPLTVGVPYAIKIQRLVGGFWKMYVNKYTTAVTIADSLQSTIANSDNYADNSVMNLNYTNCALEAVNLNSTVASAFQFDELHMYTRYLSFTGVASPANGVTPSPYYAGEGTVILYGYQLQMRGNYELGGQIYMGKNDGSGYFEGNFQSTNGTLYRTANSYFAVATATPVATVSLSGGGIGGTSSASSASLNDSYFTSGNYNGSLSLPGYYFITAVVANTLQSYQLASGYSTSFTGNVQVYDYAKNTTPTSVVSSAGSTASNITFGALYDWKGGSATLGVYLWSTGANWVQGTAPSTSSDVVRIGVYATSYPYTQQPTLTANATIGLLIVGPNVTSGGGGIEQLNLSNGLAGTTLTLNSGLNINAGGLFKLNGLSLLSLGALTLPSGTNSTIASTGNLSANFATITNSGNFTLLSDANGSAGIGQLTNSTIGGSYMVQRYISGGTANARGYRLLSSPVYAGNVSGIGNVVDLTYLKNYMILTGTGGSAGGFDLAGNPTLYLYRENTAFSNGLFSGGNFRGLSSISTGITNQVAVTTDGNYYVPVGNGYWVYYRGDRTDNVYNKTNAPYATAENTTLSTTGSITQGQVNVIWWYGKTTALSYSPAIAGNSSIYGFNMVGNPYPCSINWDTFSATNAAAAIYGPSLSTKYYIYNPVTKNYATYISGSSGVGTYNTTNANVIPSGQGFYVRAIATGPSITFNEAAKTTGVVTSSNLTLDALPASVAPATYFRLKLQQDSLNYDYALFFLKQGTSNGYVEAEDAITFVGGGSVGLSSISSDNYGLAINSMPLPGLTQTTVPLKVYVTANGIYSLQMAGNANIPQLFDVWLMDAYKKDSLDIKHNTTYNFNVYGSDTSSYGSKRFTVVIRQNPAYAYKLLGFSGVKKLDGAQLKWETENEVNYTSFTLERSTDNGATYTGLTTVQGSSTGAYTYLDAKPALGNNLYRLKQIDINNVVTYSKVVTIGFANSGNSISNNLNLYPNPASSVINLYVVQSMQTANAVYDIKIMSMSGNLVKHTTSTQPTWQGSVADLMPGTYVIEVINSTTQTKVGNTKFVKI